MMRHERNGKGCYRKQIRLNQLLGNRQAKRTGAVTRITSASIARDQSRVSLQPMLRITQAVKSGLVRENPIVHFQCQIMEIIKVPN